MNDLFRHFALKTSEIVGSPWAFILAVAILIIWAVSGPIFGFSDTWQLMINTGTTIVTFLMVFLIQNTQNRESRAIQLKLDELIRASTEARTRLVDLEDLSDAELQQLREEFKALQARAAQGAEEVAEALEDTSHDTGAGEDKRAAA
jgi:low affinity Fe/Cu permease